MKTRLHEGVAAISSMIREEETGRRLVLRVVSVTDGSVIDIDLHDIGVALKKRCPELFEVSAREHTKMIALRKSRDGRRK